MGADPWAAYWFPPGAVLNSTAGVSWHRKTGWRDWTGWETWSGWDEPNDAGARWQKRDDADASWPKWDDAGASWQTKDDAGASWQKRDTVGASWQTGGERAQWHGREYAGAQEKDADLDVDAGWDTHECSSSSDSREDPFFGASWQKRDDWNVCAKWETHERDLELKFNDRWQTSADAGASWQKRDDWNVCAEWETPTDPLECPTDGASSADSAELETLTDTMSALVVCEDPMVGASSAHVSGMRADGTLGTPGVWQTHGPQEGGSNCSEGPWKEANRRKKDKKLWAIGKQNLIQLSEFAWER
jgi:hypothetical protein